MHDILSTFLACCICNYKVGNHPELFKDVFACAFNHVICFKCSAYMTEREIWPQCTRCDEITGSPQSYFHKKAFATEMVRRLLYVDAQKRLADSIVGRCLGCFHEMDDGIVLQHTRACLRILPFVTLGRKTHAHHLVRALNLVRVGHDTFSLGGPEEFTMLLKIERNFSDGVYQHSVQIRCWNCKDEASLSVILFSKTETKTFLSGPFIISGQGGTLKWEESTLRARHAQEEIWVGVKCQQLEPVKKEGRKKTEVTTHIEESGAGGEKFDTLIDRSRAATDSPGDGEKRARIASRDKERKGSSQEGEEEEAGARAAGEDWEPILNEFLQKGLDNLK